MPIVTKKFTGLQNDKTYFARIYPVNKSGYCQSELTGQVVSAQTKEPPKEFIIFGNGADTSLTGGWYTDDYTDTTACRVQYGASSEGGVSWTLTGNTWHEGQDDEELECARIHSSTNNIVDVTNYSQIICTGSSVIFGLKVGSSVRPTYNTSWASSSYTGSGVATATLDISALSGSYYICFYDAQCGDGSRSGRCTSIILKA